MPRVALVEGVADHDGGIDPTAPAGSLVRSRIGGHSTVASTTPEPGGHVARTDRRLGGSALSGPGRSGRLVPVEDEREPGGRLS